jgi:hypothetical protein
VNVNGLRAVNRRNEKAAARSRLHTYWSIGFELTGQVPGSRAQWQRG